MQPPNNDDVRGKALDPGHLWCLGLCRTWDSTQHLELDGPGKYRELQRCIGYDTEDLRPVISCFSLNCPAASCQRCGQVMSCEHCGLPVCYACMRWIHPAICTGDPTTCPSKWDVSIHGAFPWCTTCRAPHAIADCWCEECGQYQCIGDGGRNCVSSIRSCRGPCGKDICHRQRCGRWSSHQRRITRGRRLSYFVTPMINFSLGSRMDMEEVNLFFCVQCIDNGSQALWLQQHRVVEL